VRGALKCFLHKNEDSSRARDWGRRKRHEELLESKKAE
jgi:hypothetical protein